jgi:CRISPR-associated protein Csm3
MTDVNLYGRVIITADILAVTGLHIGGSNMGLEIGGLDKAVIRNPLNHQPYIPGSSLRGKMRSQTEKVLGLPQNKAIGQATIHVCQSKDEYEKNGGCPVCHVFGVPAPAPPEPPFSGPTRLVVRDVFLTKDSADALDRVNSDLRYAELKTEVAIDRVTSAAVPRTLERVPAGAVFGRAEFVFGIYRKADHDRLKTVIQALQLVEDDYLGGAGSRGSGKVQFQNINVSARKRDDYSTAAQFESTFESVQMLADKFDTLKAWLAQNVPAE